MGNTTGKAKYVKNEHLVTAQVVQDEPSKLLTVAEVNNLKIPSKTIVYLNPDFVGWSIGYVVKMEDNNVYVLDKYTSKLNIFNLNSAALLWNNQPIHPNEPRINTNGKISYNLCLLGDSKTKKYNNSKSYVSFSHHENRSNMLKSSNSDVKLLFSNIKFTFNDDQKINYPEFYLGNKVSILFVKNMRNATVEHVWGNAIIFSINQKTITLLMKDRDEIKSFNIDRKYLNHIEKYNPNIGHRLFSSVKYNVNNKYIYGVITDIIGNEAKMTNHPNLVKLNDLELIDITLEECDKYISGKKTCDKFPFIER